jgi:hypothetical protein
MDMAMKKIGWVALVMLLGLNAAWAKKVKFAVNMTGQTINVTGMHITGDFQTLAGYAGGDWNSGSTSLVQETGDTNIYSIVVDIPAHAKYEYKFVNGDQFYEVEFVPVESRVGYLFNDNRWIYIDSLSDDTTLVGPLVWSGNAPANKQLMRFLVDMHEEPSVSPLGVHIAGSFQGWNPAGNRMYSFVTDIWEHIGYVDSLVADAEFLYYNGNTLGDAEVVSGSCTQSGNRHIIVPNDTVLPTVCFGSCTACVTSAVAQVWEPRVSVYPNPAVDAAMVRLDNHFGAWTMEVMDGQGRILRSLKGEGEQAVRIEREGLADGIYYVRVTHSAGASSVQKWIFR